MPAARRPCRAPSPPARRSACSGRRPRSNRPGTRRPPSRPDRRETRSSPRRTRPPRRRHRRRPSRSSRRSTTTKPRSSPSSASRSPSNPTRARRQNRSRRRAEWPSRSKLLVEGRGPRIPEFRATENPIEPIGSAGRDVVGRRPALRGHVGAHAHRAARARAFRRLVERERRTPRRVEAALRREVAFAVVVRPPGVVRAVHADVRDARPTNARRRRSPSGSPRPRPSARASPTDAPA